MTVWAAGVSCGRPCDDDGVGLHVQRLGEEYYILCLRWCLRKGGKRKLESGIRRDKGGSEAEKEK